MTPESRAILRETLARDEGIRFKPYRDTVGKLTIGVGRNLDDVGISRVTAMQMLDEDIDHAMAGLDLRLKWWRLLDEVRQRVLLNLAFNMGTGRLLDFHHTLACMEDGRYEDAADAMLESKWANQVGARAMRLSTAMRVGKEAM